MNFSESVYELSENFMKKPHFVFMNKDQIEVTANVMKRDGKPDFPLPDVENAIQVVTLELVAASINYCYWYGKHNIRPNNSSSTSMYNLLMKSFKDRATFDGGIENFIEQLSIERYPLLEERVQHLRQLKNGGERFAYDIYTNHESMTPHFSHLIKSYPGFASDMFLKRASLFFIQLYRRFGWFAEELKNLHVPADYQVPKMLTHNGCITYGDDLQYAIDNHQIIPKHSMAECEIRSATVLSIKKLCELTEWNVAEVDGYFFTRRHNTHNPFHLCITTDY